MAVRSRPSPSRPTRRRWRRARSSRPAARTTRRRPTAGPWPRRWRAPRSRWFQIVVLRDQDAEHFNTVRFQSSGNGVDGALRQPVLDAERVGARRDPPHARVPAAIILINLGARVVVVSSHIRRVGHRRLTYVIDTLRVPIFVDLAVRHHHTQPEGVVVLSFIKTDTFCVLVTFSSSIIVSVTVTCVGARHCREIRVLMRCRRVDGVGSRVGVPRRGRTFSSTDRFSRVVTLMTVVMLCVS